MTSTEPKEQPPAAAGIIPYEVSCCAPFCCSRYCHWSPSDFNPVEAVPQQPGPGGGSARLRRHIEESQVNTWFDSLPVELEMLVANPSVRASMAELLVGQLNEFMLTGWRTILVDTLQVSKSSGQKFDEVFLIDANGSVVVSTDPGHEGYLLVDEPFFQQG